MPSERDISRLLAARENGECEVKTLAGFIDVLTPSVLYEVKTASGWKGALGQVLSYGKYYPDRKLKLYLYGKTSGEQKQLIKEQCAAHNVGVEWHREPRPDEPTPATVAAPIVDSIKLNLSVIDEYNNKAMSNINIVAPTTPIEQNVLDGYLDQAIAVFDALLGNGLTLTLQYAFRGERIKLTRTRPSIYGKPIMHRLHISIMPSTRFLFSVSLPGIRAQLSNGYQISPDTNYAEATQTPEMVALRELILHPDFCWMSGRGEPAVKVMKIMRQVVKQ